MATGEVALRPARDEDAGAIAEIWHEGWRDGHLAHVSDDVARLRTRESFEARAPHRIADAWVALRDGEVAGFVMVVEDEVEQVYVARRHRGSGVADRLLAQAELHVRESGHERAWLAVIEGNIRARRFYERVGWSDEGPFDYEAASEAGPIVFRCHRYVKRV
jgi:ribosomal protein S18 acetylase RimI-like enzyme